MIKQNRWLIAVLLAGLPGALELTLPPLSRDTHAFSEIGSTFAPKGTKGIIHWLPGYCLGGRLIVFAGSIVGSLTTRV
jgi:hypothetical protein